MNPILDVDSYKSSHFLQFPPNTTYMFSYLESRGGKFEEVVFFGLQYILIKYLTVKITEAMVDEASDFMKTHGVPFNYEGWMYVAKDLKGALPVRIRAVKEGSVVPVKNVLMTVESTDPKCFWIVTWLETMLMRVWYPCTVATQSYAIKKEIEKYLDLTSDNPKAELPFKLHDFGARGVSSCESSAIGGAAHLTQFQGSDTIAGILCANNYYHHKMAGFSIPASEHSSITSWGRENELGAYRNMIKQFGHEGSVFACVSDSYDYFSAVQNLWGGELKQEIIDSGAKLIIRPDSGKPADTVLTTLNILSERFGFTYNKKNFKVVNNVGVIQGDGVNYESICEIYSTIMSKGYSASNVNVGMGGALLQQVNRDTQCFAYKCSNVTINGTSVDVFKAPTHDPLKRSKAGKLDLVRRLGQYTTVAGIDNYGSELHVVYENGNVLRTYSLDEIRTQCMI